MSKRLAASDESEAVIGTKPDLRLLVVCDGKLVFDDTSDLGLALSLKSMKKASDDLGLVNLAVSLATRDGAQSYNIAPAAGQPNYTGFRFDVRNADGSLVIDNFHEIFLFGYRPGNEIDDASNDLPKHSPTSDQELAALFRWMNQNQDGLYATGDHRAIGACMCRRVPRVAKMRRWTAAQDSPPYYGLQRFDTTRPATPEENDIGSGRPAQIPFENQSDAIPKPVYSSFGGASGVNATSRNAGVHPVLEFGNQSSIGVLPDHGHEGHVLDSADIITGDRPTFGTYSFDEFPIVHEAAPLLRFPDHRDR